MIQNPPSYISFTSLHQPWKPHPRDIAVRNGSIKMPFLN